MNNPTRRLPEGNPVLRVANQSGKSTAAASYRKGWQFAQHLLEQQQQPKTSCTL